MADVTCTHMKHGWYFMHGYHGWCDLGTKTGQHSSRMPFLKAWTLTLAISQLVYISVVYTNLPSQQSSPLYFRNGRPSKKNGTCALHMWLTLVSCMTKSEPVGLHCQSLFCGVTPFTWLAAMLHAMQKISTWPWQLQWGLLCCQIYWSQIDPAWALLQWWHANAVRQARARFRAATCPTNPWSILHLSHSASPFMNHCCDKVRT